MIDSRIQAVFWDIGGVLARTEDRSVRARLAHRLGTTYDRLDELVWGGERGRLAQEGKIDEVDQWEYVCQELGVPFEEYPQLKREFYGGDRIDHELVEFIRSLKPDYKLGVISNAMSGARNFLETEAGIADVFEAITYSYEVGVMKPDRRIFQAALDSLSVDASESVFIDDFQHNVEGAESIGMQAILFHSREQVIGDLNRILRNQAGPHLIV